ncbi:MAG: LysM peptidoglycan-binding domain-containing protein [Anaerolineales bacterium]|nr:LysM peptidoglycan-binding domain-containing protein [Anaerolineales bacterium]
MNRIISYFWLIIIMALGLFGCDIPRGDQATGDIDQFSPPAAASPAASPPAQAAVAQAEGVIRFEPSAAQVGAGNPQVVELRIENVTNLAGAEVQVQFNPAVLQVQDADPGKDGIQIEPGSFPAPDFVASNVVSNTVGLLQYAVVQIPPTQPVSGSGLLARITFQTLAAGTSDLIFTRADLATGDAQPIAVTRQSGQIVVSGPGPIVSPTSTNTPIPGQPTPTMTPLPPPGTVTPVIPTPIPTLIPTFTPTPLPPPSPTAVAPQVFIPPGATQGFCYRVQPGDTLESLAYTYGTDPGFISLANDLYPPGHIYPQQVLFMPTAYGNGPNVYVIQPGDTLAGIADQCQLKVDVLAYVNGLAENANLDGIGVLIIPRPPFAPPSRYPYPQVGPPSVWPPPCSGSCYK